MATIQTLAVNELSFRGKGNEFNKFSRLFKSLTEARESLASGDYNPVEGQLNLVIVAGQGIMYYSFDLADFVLIDEFNAVGNQADKYIELDGANDYIEMTNIGAAAADVMDLTKSWSIGVTLVGYQEGTDNHKIALFSRGGVIITLNRGGSNMGPYVTAEYDLYTGAHAEANNFHGIGQFDRLLFVNDASTGKLRMYVGTPEGSFAERALLTVTDAMRNNQQLGTSICIGKGFDGPGGATFDGAMWDGGVNNVIGMARAMATPEINQYFQLGDQFSVMEFYPDLAFHLKLGEDTFPNVTDEKGNLTGGSLVNGTAEDFVNIPTE
ncbi:MAG: hypothetical protein AAGJ17_00125 [Pseudomonadota bacterium]